MTYETRPRTRINSSRPGSSVLQKMQPSIGPLAFVTYASLHGDQRRSRRYTASASGGADASPAGDPADGSLLISSFSTLPGLKYGTFFGGTSTLSPVFGLRPLRGSRLRRRKLPNPRSSIFSPRCSASMMLLNTVSTITSECFFVRSDTRETSSTSSAFVMLPLVIACSLQPTIDF